MIPITIIVDAEGKFSHLQGVKESSSDITIATLPNGTRSGRAAIIVQLELPDGGGYAFAQNTLQNFIAAMVAFSVKFPEEFRYAGVTLEVTPFPQGKQ